MHLVLLFCCFASGTQKAIEKRTRTVDRINLHLVENFGIGKQSLLFKVMRIATLLLLLLSTPFFQHRGFSAVASKADDYAHPGRLLNVGKSNIMLERKRSSSVNLRGSVLNENGVDDLERRLADRNTVSLIVGGCVVCCLDRTCG